MGVMAPHFVSDHCSDPLRVRQNVVVPKAQDAEALAPQEACSADLLFRLAIMLTAIDLNDQLDFVTDEVGDIASNWNLTKKPAPIQLTLTEQSPQPALRVRHPAPQCTCPSNRAVDRMSFHRRFAAGTITPTQPSPIKGEGFKWACDYECRCTSGCGPCAAAAPPPGGSGWCRVWRRCGAPGRPWRRRAGRGRSTPRPRWRP